MRARLFFSLLFTVNAVFAQTNKLLLIGTYTSDGSEGIYVYNFNAATGDNSFVSAVKTPNPSYLAVSPDQRMVYAVSENADSTQFGVGGFVSAFSFNKHKQKLTWI